MNAFAALGLVLSLPTSRVFAQTFTQANVTVRSPGDSQSGTPSFQASYVVGSDPATMVVCNQAPPPIAAVPVVNPVKFVFDDPDIAGQSCIGELYT